VRLARSLPRDRWVASPRRLLALLGGLWVFGVGEALLVAADLGTSPWTVLAQGLAEQVGLGVGTTTILVSAAVLAAWIPLRQTPGLGTVLNAIVIGVSLGATLDVLGRPDGLALRLAAVAAGVGLVGIGSATYLACRLGPGPRDGLMTGLHRRTGLSLRLVRTGIELSVVVAGFLLGGTVGVGTVAFALTIGPLVQRVLHALSTAPTVEL
jgi:uncharacterized membrane protein YczE